MSKRNKRSKARDEKRKSKTSVNSSIKSLYVTGIADVTKKGHAFIIVEGIDEDIFVPSANLKHALHGDKVKVLLHAGRSGKRTEGEVVEIIERKRNDFTGILEMSDKFAFFIADDKRMNIDIFIPLKNTKGAEHGDKVIVEITEWQENSKSPVGKVIKVLGKPGEHEAEMHAIINEFKLPIDFPSNVLKAADNIPLELNEKDLSGRKDFRKTPTFTIDPEDAKDFDDALSISKTAGNLWEIGVHIADVTHYVKPGSVIDKEAIKRATSVYLVDRVIPMLPERLSNEICSLKPNEDRLTFSAVFEISDDGNVKKEWFGKSVICSQHRFSYEKAQEVLETKKGPFANELAKLNQIAEILREKKFKSGAISFETTEVKFELDENNHPVNIINKVRKDAHKLIEDFMLLANRSVATFVSNKGEKDAYPFVYRVHDDPDKDKLEAFSKIAATFGYKINVSNKQNTAASLNYLLQKVEGRPEQNLLENLAIRTMTKAIYTTHKSSHYGLAFENYTHFTSPIRRYPDVLVHRLLQKYLESKRLMETDELEALCTHSSNMESRAVEAERASVKYKQVEYMSRFIGDEFDGIISGVAEWGIYVELKENKCEGLVQMSSLIDDYYFLDKDNFRIVGNNTAKVYQLGDEVRIRVMNANINNKTLDFDIVMK